MHSGADVEAFQAALNRDIEGDAPTSQHSGSHLYLKEAILHHGRSLGKTETSTSKINKSFKVHSSNIRLHLRWSKSNRELLLRGVSQMTGIQTTEKSPTPLEPERTNNKDSESQYAKLQKMSDLQSSGAAQPNNPVHRGKQVPFAVLLPALSPQLDKDRAMQLHTLYDKLKKNEIAKDGFVRHMRDIVGDQMLRLAVNKLQVQMSSNQSPPQSHVGARPNTPRMSSVGGATQFTGPHSLTQLHQKGPNSAANSTQLPSPAVPMQTNSSSQISSSGSTTVNQERGCSSIPPQGINKQQHLNFPQNPFSVHGSNSYHTYSGPNVNTSGGSVPWQASLSKELNPSPLSSAAYVKQESVDQGADQHRPHLSAIQGVSNTLVEQGNTPNDEPGEKQSSRVGFSTPSITAQMDSNLGSRNPSVPTPAGVNARTPQKRPSLGQGKPPEALGSSPPPSSKKQKVSGAFSDQSIEQLNDVTAVSGVNLREEEEQLLSGPKDESRVSEASRKVVQEEEERLFLKKTPLQKKLAEIMAKSDLKNISNDVGRCLSLSVEERMRGLICNLIRLSKQRVDVEKPRHRTLITSDVRQQILMLNQNARGEWEKKQAEVEKLRKLNEPEAETVADGDKENDERDDMLSKWQLMAEQARQKREGGTDAASGSQAGKDVNCRPSSASGKSTKDNEESEKRGLRSSHASGVIKKFGRNQGVMLTPNTRVARTVSVKDVIAALEREPQMSSSTLTYSLFLQVKFALS
ncbi:TBP-associated factor 4, putative isoform 2 [Hibiscus syriacus]|uniref:TBP-associated factor 4, putative isoform 2 n=1 Tax=Hibiscus syriacus TaxID=106335 RepID=A0A6A2YS46_HIBSY|nr:TBP-associated factor 4, putative isoform 2 [Hibiscus syriacus]